MSTAGQNGLFSKNAITLLFTGRNNSVHVKGIWEITHRKQNFSLVIAEMLPGSMIQGAVFIYSDTEPTVLQYFL